MTPRKKALQLLAESYYNIESNNATNMTLDIINTIILELKSIKECELKQRVQYWQQVKDSLPPGK